jgi:hypothetical protein
VRTQKGVKRKIQTARRRRGRLEGESVSAAWLVAVLFSDDVGSSVPLEGQPLAALRNG